MRIPGAAACAGGGRRGCAGALSLAAALRVHGGQWLGIHDIGHGTDLSEFLFLAVLGLHGTMAAGGKQQTINIGTMPLEQVYICIYTHTATHTHTHTHTHAHTRTHTHIYT